MEVAEAEKRITNWLAEQQPAMLALLEEAVNTDSGSYDKVGVDQCGAVFERFFASQGIATNREEQEVYGDAIHVLPGDTGSNERPIVLMGHRDTVFPIGEPARRPFRIDKGRAYGPGVADMKAGLVINAFVITAFKTLGGAPRPIAGLITSDEEIGSPACRPVIERVARDAKAVFNSEPGRPSGNVVTQRKGGVFMAMKITGKPAHSGGNFENGISAIGELAHKIIAIHALTDLKRGITLNVGIIKGGEAVNMVAPFAEAAIDMRYKEPADRDEIVAKIQDIVTTSTLAGATGTLEIKGEFRPLNPTPGSEALFQTYKASAAAVGLKVEGEFSGGCADSGFTSAVGCPTVCAVGPIGGHAHTPEEYLEVASIVPRAQALALAIMRLG